MDSTEIKKYAQSIGIPQIVSPVAALIVVFMMYNPIMPVKNCWGAFNDKIASASELRNKQKEYSALQAQEEARKNSKKRSEKVIFEPAEMQLGTGASFAEPFEDMINIARDSKIRIKSIKYDYSPKEDPIIQGKLNGYNACEMKIEAVGTYSQLKQFFTGVLGKPYLTKVSNIMIEPWGFDKSILIANINLTLYTYTGK
ncbi:hypothetical protein IKA92_03470 [bacterium]|nr:hypothetical protein [bacterium]